MVPYYHSHNLQKYIACVHKHNAGHNFTILLSLHTAPLISDRQFGAGGGDKFHFLLQQNTQAYSAVQLT